MQLGRVVAAQPDGTAADIRPAGRAEDIPDGVVEVDSPEPGIAAASTRRGRSCIGDGACLHFDDGGKKLLRVDDVFDAGRILRPRGCESIERQQAATQRRTSSRR